MYYDLEVQPSHIPPLEYFFIEENKTTRRRKIQIFNLVRLTIMVDLL